MGTRSQIAEEQENGSILSIYVHWDGYPSHVGKTLREHYTSLRKIHALMNLGSLSSLGEEIGQKHDFDKSNEGEARNWCTAYGRDRGEDNTSATLHKDAEEFWKDAGKSWCEWAYVYRGGDWYVSKIGGGAGLFLVSAKDPDGTAAPSWVKVSDLDFSPDAEGSIPYDGRYYDIVSARKEAAAREEAEAA